MTSSIGESKDCLLFGIVQVINMSTGHTAQADFDTETKYKATVIFSEDNLNNGAVVHKLSEQTNNNCEATHIRTQLCFLNQDILLKI